MDAALSDQFLHQAASRLPQTVVEVGVLFAAFLPARRIGAVDGFCKWWFCSALVATAGSFCCVCVQQLGYSHDRWSARLVFKRRRSALSGPARQTEPHCSLLIAHCSPNHKGKGTGRKPWSIDHEINPSDRITHPGTIKISRFDSPPTPDPNLHVFGDFASVKAIDKIDNK